MILKPLNVTFCLPVLYLYIRNHFINKTITYYLKLHILEHSV